MTSDSPLRTPRALGLDNGLERAGFNVAGALHVETYDALVPDPWQSSAVLPGARRALVLGCGGRSFGRALLASPDDRARPDPVDHFTARIISQAVTAHTRGGLRARALYTWERRAGAHADFVALGRRAGLGVPSRLGLLLHPTYGPWLALRAVVLTEADDVVTPPLTHFDPCRGCPAPCTRACPVGAPGIDGFDVVACAGHRARPGHCVDRCAARRACPVGEVQAYAPALERLHLAASARWISQTRNRDGTRGFESAESAESS